MGLHWGLNWVSFSAAGLASPRGEAVAARRLMRWHRFSAVRLWQGIHAPPHPPHLRSAPSPQGEGFASAAGLASPRGEAVCAGRLMRWHRFSAVRLWQGFAPHLIRLTFVRHLPLEGKALPPRWVAEKLSIFTRPGRTVHCPRAGQGKSWKLVQRLRLSALLARWPNTVWIRHTTTITSSSEAYITLC